MASANAASASVGRADSITSVRVKEGMTQSRLAYAWFVPTQQTRRVYRRLPN